MYRHFSHGLLFQPCQLLCWFASVSGCMLNCLISVSYLSTAFPTCPMETLINFVHNQIGRRDHSIENWDSLRFHCTQPSESA